MLETEIEKLQESHSFDNDRLQTQLDKQQEIFRNDSETLKK
jgi:hypothetical protein